MATLSRKTFVAAIGAQAGHVEDDLEVGESDEARGEPQGEQEREQHLCAGLCDPDFLQDLGVAAIEALLRSLVYLRLLVT